MVMLSTEHLSLSKHAGNKVLPTKYTGPFVVVQVINRLQLLISLRQMHKHNQLIIVGW
jgi:hypothetical protein